jgi:hypothetical protein
MSAHRRVDTITIRESSVTGLDLKGHSDTYQRLGRQIEVLSKAGRPGQFVGDFVPGEVIL